MPRGLTSSRRPCNGFVADGPGEFIRAPLRSPFTICADASGRIFFFRRPRRAVSTHANALRRLLAHDRGDSNLHPIPAVRPTSYQDRRLPYLREAKRQSSFDLIINCGCHGRVLASV